LFIFLSLDYFFIGLFGLFGLLLPLVPVATTGLTGSGSLRFLTTTLKCLGAGQKTGASVVAVFIKTKIFFFLILYYINISLKIP
jgi:hypothetical protein